MWELLSTIGDAGELPPRGRSGDWTASLSWLPIGSGLAICVASLAAATLLVLFAYRSKRLALAVLKSTLVRLEQETVKREQAEALLESALDACPSGILLVDPRGTIVLANTLLLDWFGYKREELLGQPLKVLGSQLAGAAQPDRGCSCSANSETPALGEASDLHGVTKDGAEIHVAIALNPVPTPDGAMMLANVMNIAHRKLTESALIAKTKEMDQLMYIVSHDLRSPLVTIEGFAGLIGEHLSAHLFDRASDDLVRVKRATHTMSALIRDILELSRVNRQHMKLERVDTRDVLDEAVESLSGPLSKADAHVAIDGEFPIIEGDRNQLLQVFANLLGNAVKFGCQRAGSTITVRSVRMGKEAAFSVHDEGAGVDPSDCDKIFQPFQRGDHDREGSGMGLAIVKNVMELHAGRAWVEPASDGGATFWIAFPAAAASRPVRQLV